jgi:hypothetical protein
MVSKSNPRIINSSELEEFISAASSKERTEIIHKWRQNSLTIDHDLLKGLIHFPLSQDEIMSAFEICQPTYRAGFELWVMDHLLGWEQNIAATAIRTWATATDRILWHRLIPIAASPGLPQRIRFTILDIATLSHGFELVRATLNAKDWEELSPAFHALLFERCLQFDLFDSRLNRLAWKILDINRSTSFPEDKSLIPAVCWLCRHAEDELKKWIASGPRAIWIEATSAIIENHDRRTNEISKLEKLLTKDADKLDQPPKLPAIWSRGEIKLTILNKLLRLAPSNPGLLDGLPIVAISGEGPIISLSDSWLDSLISHQPFGKFPGPANGAGSIFSKSYNTNVFAKLHSARENAVAGKSNMSSDKISNTKEFSDEPESKAIIEHPFMDFVSVLSKTTNGTISGNGSWSLLAKSWLSPETTDINSLTAATRKGRGLMTLAHIMSMSKLKGRDDAVLKLLDHIRSNDETEIRSVARALGAINTPRSLLELINMLTRPNASIVVKQEIVNILSSKDLSALQKELRSVVHDFELPQNTDHPLFQLKDELSALLLPGNKPTVVAFRNEDTNETDGENLDIELAGMIPNYNHLSSEVKRALRTALFFNRTVTSSKHANEIDLSPLIDMQYKAMELLYREFFEDHVSQILQRGNIQRKLDVIGYARPILRNMDDFESFIAALPVVREIPFFSKFKLRKMLRALCQFEPGKRFTLDGLKAFGLFFFVFGRQQCKHGLASLVVTGAKDDIELAEYCRELHIFQDFRNRAAHEGFHPDASNDILGIWRTTALLVQWAFKAKDAQKTANSTAVKTAS